MAIGSCFLTFGAPQLVCEPGPWSGRTRFTKVNVSPLLMRKEWSRLRGFSVDRPCCLILEDQALIGLALEASLEEAGFDVAGPFDSASDALRWLTERKPDLALVDVLVRDGTCVSVARELRRKKVPFAIYSGLKPPEPVAPEFEDVPWLQKPVSREQLSATLLRLSRTCSLVGIVAPSEATESRVSPTRSWNG